MTEPKLKPCPFCGSEDLKAFIPYVRCLACFATGPERLTQAEAIAAWNQRANEEHVK